MTKHKCDCPIGDKCPFEYKGQCAYKKSEEQRTKIKNQG